MSLRQRIGLVVLWFVSIAAVGAFARGQTQPVQPVAPTVISGADFGFRVEGRKGNTPMGTLVVRVNGQWVEAELGAPAVRRLTAR